MKDRVPTHPGRVKLKPVSGQANTYDMVRADEPTQEGTPLNKASLLQDETAALYGQGADAVPDDILSILSKAVLNVDGNLQDIGGSKVGIRMATGSYVGTGTYGASNPCSLTFDFAPRIVFIFFKRYINEYGIRYKLDMGNALGTFIFNPYGLSNEFYIRNGYDATLNGFYSYAPNCYAKFDDATNTLWWYSTQSASNQANSGGDNNAKFEYHYVGIG